MNNDVSLRCKFCLFGPPASGKGTVGAFLKEQFDCEIITPGDIYRRLREEESELGQIVRHHLKDGGYCPDDLTNRIILEEATRLNGKNFILDGFPRTIAQYDFLNQNMVVDCFLCFNAPYEMLLTASMNRIQCSGCNKVWSRLMNEQDCCSCTPKNWRHRFDDSAEMYPKRYAVYQELTQPIIDIVSKLPNCIALQSLNNPNVISEALERINALGI